MAFSLGVTTGLREARPRRPPRRGGLDLWHGFCSLAPCQVSRAGRGKYPERDQPGDCAASKQQLAGLDMKSFSCASTE